MTHGAQGIDARLDALHEHTERHRADARAAVEAAHAELLDESEQAPEIVEGNGHAEPPERPTRPG